MHNYERRNLGNTWRHYLTSSGRRLRSAFITASSQLLPVVSYITLSAFVFKCEVPGKCTRNLNEHRPTTQLPQLPTPLAHSPKRLPLNFKRKMSFPISFAELIYMEVRSVCACVCVYPSHSPFRPHPTAHL